MLIRKQKSKILKGKKRITKYFKLNCKPVEQNDPKETSLNKLISTGDEQTAKNSEITIEDVPM